MVAKTTTSVGRTASSAPDDCPASDALWRSPAIVKRFWKRDYRSGTGIRKRLPSGETSQNKIPDGT